MNFILYFAIPLFYKTMKPVYFKHLLLFIIPIEYLLSKTIDRSKLPSIHSSLCNFVKNLENLYDPHILKSSAHELLHLVHCTEVIGPLNQTSCFPFEELNRKVKRLIKGADLIGDEFIKLLNVSKNLSIYAKNFQDTDRNKFVKFILKNFRLKSSNSKYKANHTILIKAGKKTEIHPNPILIDFLDRTLNLELDFIFYDHLVFNNIIFSIEKKTKFTNHIISFDGKFGFIKYIIKSNGIFYIICNNIIIGSRPFTTINLISHYSLCTISKNFFMITQNSFGMLKKHFIYRRDNLNFITYFMGNHIFS